MTDEGNDQALALGAQSGQAMKAASLCTGIGGLDRAVEAVWPGTLLAWTAEMDRHARTILTRHWPDATHHGRFDHDGITDGPAWQELPHVDILTAGFPCQDISYAGKGAGINGPRSSVFFHVAQAVHVLRPRWVVIENVGALRRRGLDVVTHTLAGLGYVGSWCSVRASDIGAPHRRERVFIVATDSHGQGRQGERGAVAAAGTRPHVEPRRPRRVPPDADSDGLGRLSVDHCDTHRACQADHVDRDDAHRRGVDRWGRYWPAVHRWEQLTGERAPDPLVNGRLNPDLPRWMMGFPAGWLDGIPKTAQLRAAGNAVCPPQGVLGIRTCLDLLAGLGSVRPQPDHPGQFNLFNWPA